MTDTQNDATVNLIRALIQNMSGPAEGLDAWESLTFIIDSFEGTFNSASGYAYTSAGEIIAVSADPWKVIPFVNAYTSGYYKPGERLPVKFLVQFHRPSGSYKITFEETNEERWKIRPNNFAELRKDLQPVIEADGMVGDPRV